MQGCDCCNLCKLWINSYKTSNFKKQLLFPLLYYNNNSHKLLLICKDVNIAIGDVANWKRHQRLDEILIFFFYPHYIREISKVV